MKDFSTTALVCTPSYSLYMAETAELMGFDPLKDFRLRYNIQLVVEIPEKKGRKKEHVDFVSHLIKKAVGMEVKK